MTSDTVTQPTRATNPPSAVTPTRAAKELGLKRGEFDLAAMLGRIRTVGEAASGQRRVTREEIDRVRAGEGFPEALRESVRTVGTTEGAELMHITTARFTRLARAGVLTPVKFYLNRYRAVVWLYLAEELRHFAESEINARLLTGRMPETMRGRLDEGQDLRARNWRGRYAGFLLRQSGDAWERAAAMASLLDPVQIAEIVRDPYERAYLHRLQPVPRTHGAPDSPGARIVERITTADDPDEIRWLRSSLLIGLVQARAQRAAPRPAPRVTSGPTTPVAATAPSNEATAEFTAEATVQGSAQESRSLMKWLRRRRA
ncbi:DUF6397 family protein [Streptomyces sp. NPDC046465]|uniref:DUF6397 family protein n=1 Tax=Streptomyces sp. NPDC046465 TaxID=3155810 RepID=UPI0033E48C4D